jgi:predicted anti-sigma-YlaC factor YlaD
VTALARARLDLWTIAIAAVGAGSVANGVWMLAEPAHWYAELPAGVPDYGPLNLHFVRDIGCAFVSVGGALVWAALRPALRLPLLAVATLFYAGHAAVHVHDMLVGAVDAHHWLLDLPSVYLPAVLLVAATFACARPRGGAR